MRNRKLNVLIVIDSVRFGGAEKQAIMDANSLVNHDITVSLAFFETGPLKKELLPSVEQIAITAHSYPGRILELTKILHKREVDLLHAHMFRGEIIGGLAGKLSGKNVVFNEHGLGLWRRWHHIKTFRIAASFADVIVCASDECKRLRETREGIPNHKLRTLYNSFVPFADKSHPLMVDSLKHRIITELGITSESPVFVGYVGRFDRVKRIHFIIDLAIRLQNPDVLFVLAGDGPERAKIKQEIARLGLKNKFYLPGFVHEPGEYYSLFDIFVLPSERESLCVALIEAGGSGIPAVAFDVGGNREVIAHAETGFLLAEGDHEGFVCRVRQLVEDHELRAVTGKNASARMLAQFSESRRVANLISIYQQLCNR